jgi:DNA-binding transcriptional LysR family regulator
MAQPPLSVAIREVTLTEAGHVLLEGARRTLAEADRVVAAARA